MKITKSAKVTLWAGRILALLLAVLVFLLPRLLGWYLTLRPLGSNSAAAILAGETEPRVKPDIHIRKIQMQITMLMLS